jgi:hypothetical protein
MGNSMELPQKKNKTKKGTSNDRSIHPMSRYIAKGNEITVLKSFLLFVAA